MIKEAAQRRSARLTTDAMIAAIAAMIGSRRHNLGVTSSETLIDICLHSQDIAISLGRELPVTATAAAAVADRVWQLGWPWHAAQRHRACGSWPPTSNGQCFGADVHRPIEAIALGRPAASSQARD